jgi:hypothetical protein
MRSAAKQILSFDKKKLSLAMLLLYASLCATAATQDGNQQLSFSKSVTIQASPFATDDNQVRPSCFLAAHHSLSHGHSIKNYPSNILPSFFHLIILQTHSFKISEPLTLLPVYCARTRVLQL